MISDLFSQGGRLDESGPRRVVLLAGGTRFLRRLPDQDPRAEVESLILNDLHDHDLYFKQLLLTEIWIPANSSDSQLFRSYSLSYID